MSILSDPPWKSIKPNLNPKYENIFHTTAGVKDSVVKSDNPSLYRGALEISLQSATKNFN